MDRRPSQSNSSSSSAAHGDLASQLLAENFTDEQLSDFNLSSYPQVSKVRVSNTCDAVISQNLRGSAQDTIAAAEVGSSLIEEAIVNDRDIANSYKAASRRTQAQTPASFAIGEKRKTKKVLPLGSSEAMKYVRLQIEQVAAFEVSVLITGASGAGKEVIAQQIHAQSDRADMPFVAINCGAIPEELLESEMFGHEKGAFTGAIAARMGRFEMAQGGTLFLDEIGDMPLLMQVKLLRVLQEKCFERIGGNKSIKSDVRIIAATHRDLSAFIEAGKFREDLFYRLNVFPVHVLPLNDRKEDLDELLAYFIGGLDKRLRFSVSGEIMSILHQYHWPGNVRELQNLVQRLSIIAQHAEVTLRDLPEQIIAATTKAMQQHQSDVAHLGGSRLMPEVAQREAISTRINNAHFDTPYIPNHVYADQTEVAPEFDQPALNRVNPSDIIDSAYAPSFNRIKTEALQEKASDRERVYEKMTLDVGSDITEAQVLDVALAAQLGTEGVDLKVLLQEIEVSYILKSLDKTGGVVAKAARLLKLRRTTLVEKMKKLNITV